MRRVASAFHLFEVLPIDEYLRCVLNSMFLESVESSSYCNKCCWWGAGRERCCAVGCDMEVSAVLLQAGAPC